MLYNKINMQNLIESTPTLTTEIQKIMFVHFHMLYNEINMHRFFKL